jgi:hypothetical protein
MKKVDKIGSVWGLTLRCWMLGTCIFEENEG